MARQSRGGLDDVFTALADPTRRAILARLARGDAYVSELAEPHDMSFAAISRHVQVLEQASLVRRTREGRKIRCRFNAEPFDEAVGWIEFHRRLWEEKLASFGEFLEEEP